MGFAKIIIPQKEALKNLQSEVSELKKDKKEDQVVIRSLLQDNAVLLTEVKNLRTSVESLTNKFDTMISSLNKVIPQ